MCRVCRICLEVIDEDLQFFSLDTIKADPDSICIKTKLKACIPEIALNVVKNSFICNHCSTSLSVAYEFRTKCLQTEERIYNYMLQTKSDIDIIDLRLIAEIKSKFDDANNQDEEAFDNNAITEKAGEENSCSSEAKCMPVCFEQCYTVGLPDSLLIKSENCDVNEFIDTCANDDVNLDASNDNETDNESLDSIKLRTPKKAKCSKREICGDYSSNETLKSCMTLHTSENRCLENFSTPSSDQQKPFKCPNCEYCGATKSHLNRHMSIHTGLKPFKCTVCKFSTAYKNNLKDHMSIHDGYKPYKCARCEFSTSTKQHLGKHMRIHTGDRPYKCTLCGFSSAYHSSLKKHLGIHNGVKPFKCPDCEYSTTSKGRLKEHHADIHLKTRPYKCDRCDYSTARKGSYIQHMKLHSGTKKRNYRVRSGSSVINSNPQEIL